MIINKLFLLLLFYSQKKLKKILEANCTAVILYISSLKGEKDNTYSDRIVKALRLINQEFHQEKKVSSYANAVSLSERRLNEICVNNTGQIVKQLLIDSTITEAKRLISSKKNSVKEIAYHLGDNDPAYFSRFIP
jgi:AraC family transcriptional activator of pobA